MSHDEVSSLRTELAFIRAEMTKLGAQAQVTQMAVADAAHDNVNMRQSVSLVIDLIDKFEGKLAALDVEPDDTTPAAHHHVGLLMALGLSLSMSMGCATFGPEGDRIVTCAGIEVIDVLPSVARALIAGDFAELARLAKQYGFDVIACAVQQQGAEARRRAMSTANPKAALANNEVSTNAAQWLKDNRVTFK